MAKVLPFPEVVLKSMFFAHTVVDTRIITFHLELHRAFRSPVTTTIDQNKGRAQNVRTTVHNDK
eukprot:1265926-Amphidinium_carterae.1